MHILGLIVFQGFFIVNEYNTIYYYGNDLILHLVFAIDDYKYEVVLYEEIFKYCIYYLLDIFTSDLYKKNTENHL